MQKIVINRCYGGFCLSEKAVQKYGLERGTYYYGGRDDPQLVRAVEEMGEEASDPCSQLIVVTIPDGVVWEIEDYDGIERVVEVHRSWP